MKKSTFILLICVITSLLSSCSAQPANGISLRENQKQTAVPILPAPTATTQVEVLSSTPPKDCPITVSQDPLFTPPAPYSPKSPFSSDFWHGTNALWTLVPNSGVWSALPHDTAGYGQKVFWWSDRFVLSDEPQPALTVTGERLDAKAPPLTSSEATNAYASDIGSAMLTGVEFPTRGCWRITGKYKDAELSFVVWVAP